MKNLMLNSNEVTLLIGVIAMFLFVHFQQEWMGDRLGFFEKLLSLVVIIGGLRFAGVNAIALLVFAIVIGLAEAFFARSEEARDTAVAALFINAGIVATYITRLIVKTKGFAPGLKGKHVLVDVFLAIAIIIQIIVLVRMFHQPGEKDTRQRERGTEDNTKIISIAIVAGTAIIALGIFAFFMAKMTTL